MESSDEWYLDSDYRSSLEVDYQFGCLMWVSLSLCECLSLSLWVQEGCEAMLGEIRSE